MKYSLDLLRLATAAATRAGDYLRTVRRPRDPSAWTTKGHHDFVTEADRRSEEIIAEVLLKGIPGSTILGEELSPSARRQGLVWIVDPIDGTANFVHGFPHYAVSIAAEADGVLQAGIVFAVETNQLYHATNGGGAWLDEFQLRVSPIAEPGHALIGTGFPFKQLDGLPLYQRQFARIAPATAGIRRAGSAALDLAWVASGVFDGFWELVLAPWDVAAGILLVREAGGLVTDLAGAPATAGHGPVVAGNPAIQRWLVAELGNA